MISMPWSKLHLLSGTSFLQHYVKLHHWTYSRRNWKLICFASSYSFPFVCRHLDQVSRISAPYKSILLLLWSFELVWKAVDWVYLEGWGKLIFFFREFCTNYWLCWNSLQYTCFPKGFKRTTDQLKMKTEDEIFTLYNVLTIRSPRSTSPRFSDMYTIFSRAGVQIPIE